MFLLQCSACILTENNRCQNQTSKRLFFFPLHLLKTLTARENVKKKCSFLVFLQNISHHLDCLEKKKKVQVVLYITGQPNLPLHQLPPLFLSGKKTKKKKIKKSIHSDRSFCKFKLLVRRT